MKVYVIMGPRNDSGHYYGEPDPSRVLWVTDAFLSAMRMGESAPGRWIEEWEVGIGKLSTWERRHKPTEMEWTKVG